MTEDKTHANQLKLTVPEAQRQQLQSALMSLLAVLLGIVLTLAGQVVSQGLGLVDDVEPPVQPVMSTGQADPLEALGTTHMTTLALSDDLTVADDATISGDATVTGALTAGTLTVDGGTLTQTAAITISGVLTNVTILYAQN